MKQGYEERIRSQININHLSLPTGGLDRRAVVGCWVGCCLLIVCGLSYSTWLYLTDCGAYSNMPSGSIQVMHILSSLTFALVGTLIVLNQPRNWVWAALSMGCCRAAATPRSIRPYMPWQHGARQLASAAALSEVV